MKFLDEDSDFSPLIKGLSKIFLEEGMSGLVNENKFIEQIIDVENPLNEQIFNFPELIETIYGEKPGNDNPIDHHSHEIQICGNTLNGSSKWKKELAFDVAFLSRLGVRNIGLISNSFNSSSFKFNTNTLDDLQISQSLTIKKIPVLQTPVGPIIDKIELIRENNYLIDFRQKIIDNDDYDNLRETVETIENEFSNYRNTVLIEHLNKSKIANSIARNSTTFIAGKIIPGIGQMKSLISDSKNRRFNWTGFLASIENN